MRATLRCCVRGHVAYHIYQDVLGHWRWYLRNDDHRKVATSGGSYPDKAACLAAVKLIMGADARTPIYED